VNYTAHLRSLLFRHPTEASSEGCWDVKGIGCSALILATTETSSVGCRDVKGAACSALILCYHRGKLGGVRVAKGNGFSTLNLAPTELVSVEAMICELHPDLLSPLSPDPALYSLPGSPPSLPRWTQ
jgi:hypothetical protein